MKCCNFSVVLIGFLFGCLMKFVSSASLLKNTHTREALRNTRSTHEQVNQPWPCPQIMCRPIRKNCAMVEVVVFDNGPYTCQSCPYCLDHPAFRAPARNRRSAQNEAFRYAAQNKALRYAAQNEAFRYAAQNEALRYAAQHEAADVRAQSEETVDELVTKLLETHEKNQVVVSNGRHRMAKRSARVAQPIIQNSMCERLQCPTVPWISKCRQVAVLDGYLRGNKCLSCSACLDAPSRQ